MATNTRKLADLLANIDNNSKITTGGLLDATITADDLAANSVGASELADNAVDQDAIADDAVGADQLASNAVVSASIVDANITAAKLSSTALASVEHVKPHIQPGVLEPAWEGYLSDHSSAFEFYDSSPDTLTVNSFGNSVRHTPHQTKMQNTSMRFNGVDDRLEIAHNADWDWGTGDFTVEFWVRPSGAIGTENIISRKNSGTDSTFYLRFESGKLNWAAGGDHLSPSTSDFAVDNWYHVAFVKASGTMKCYKNGTQLYTFSDSVNYSSSTDASSAISIGCRILSGNYIQFGEFYLDELRVTKGLAVYTGNFTAPTGPFTTTWSANPFGGSNTAANSTASNVGLLIHSAPTGRNSGAYGTAQSDGKKYYYTDIKGSKPIKDPRIGAHFGSQRHTFRSIQKLEQESAAHGKSVYSIDGREFIRVLDNSTQVSLKVSNHGNFIQITDSPANCFIEVVGYLNDLNLSLINDTNRCTGVDISIDGAVVVDGSSTLGGDTTVASPLMGRYVDASSLINTGLTSTLGIHTAKIECKASGHFLISGIELIAQDVQNFTATNATNILTSTGHTLTNGDQIRLTGSDLPNGLNATTTYYVIGVSGNNFQVSASLGGSAVTFSDDGSGTRTFRSLNTIQIPAQNVVSYGKKFSVSATAQHYNPFAFKTDGATAWASGAHNGTSFPVGTGASTNIDTATSLGLENWKHSNNYYKPYNGGRVVKWIASDGTIKTSVNVVPPNAQNIAGSAITAKANASIANNTYLPTFSGVIDDSQAEKAKTFHIREFGNGAANGGAGAANADASMLSDSGNDDIAYVMDDGLTSHSGDDIEKQTPTASCHFLSASGNDDGHWFTFIGTGVSTIGRLSNTPTVQTWAQNLPYGTHILRIQGVTDVEETKVTLDGVVLNSSKTYMQYGGVQEIIFHQPKMPPIPDNAVVLADYMLTADFVQVTSDGNQYVSKGVRRCDSSRDVYYNNGSGNTPVFQHLGTGADLLQSVANMRVYIGASHADAEARMTAFCTNMVHYGWAIEARYQTYEVDTGSGYSAKTVSKDGTGGASYYNNSANSHDVGLASHRTKGTFASSSGYCEAVDVVSPIHTSSHYQPFETPFLHELVGGDRNMEQNNLIVTPDGKSWDEVTRDTSYIGNLVVLFRGDPSASNDTDNTNDTLTHFEDKRGTHAALQCHQKDWAIAHDRIICLKAGTYRINYHTSDANGGDGMIVINGVDAMVNLSNGSRTMITNSCVHEFIRGDYVQIEGAVQNGVYMQFFIERV